MKGLHLSHVTYDIGIMNYDIEVGDYVKDNV